MRRKVFAFIMAVCMVLETPIYAMATDVEAPAYVNQSTGETGKVLTSAQSGSSAGAEISVDVSGGSGTQSGTEVSESATGAGAEANVSVSNREGNPAGAGADTGLKAENGTVSGTGNVTENNTGSNEDNGLDDTVGSETVDKSGLITEEGLEADTEVDAAPEDDEAISDAVSGIGSEAVSKPSTSSYSRPATYAATYPTEVYYANLGMNGLSDPTLYSDSTPTWAGTRVHFGKGSELVYNIPSAIQITSTNKWNGAYTDGYTTDNIWRVLNVASGLLMADTPIKGAQSYGMTDSGRWEDSGLYNYLNGTYKSGALFSDNDRKAIKGAITIPSKEDYLNTAYGFADSADVSCGARKNIATSDSSYPGDYLRVDAGASDYSILGQGSDNAGQIVSGNANSSYYTDSANKLGFSPMLQLDTSRVFYNYYFKKSEFSSEYTYKVEEFDKTEAIEPGSISANGQESLVTLVMKSDDTGFAVSEVPTSVASGENLSFKVTGIVPDGDYNRISALLVQGGRIIADGYANTYGSPEIVEGNYYELLIGNNIPAGEYTLYLFEQYAPNSYSDATSYVSNIITQNLTVQSSSITSASVSSQSSGRITLSFEVGMPEGSNYVQIFRSESSDGTYQFHDSASFNFENSTKQEWIDTNVEIDSGTNKNKIYYYKLVRSDTKDAAEAVLDDVIPISNDGVEYELVIEGLTLLDENGSPISTSDTITLHEGESKRFTMALHMSDGTTKAITKDMKESFDQYYRDQGATGTIMMTYFSWSFGSGTSWGGGGWTADNWAEDNSYIQCYPAVDFDTKWDIIVEAKKVTPDDKTYGLKAIINEIPKTSYYKFSVPITIEPAEEGVVYENKSPIKIYDNREAFNQAIRDEWVNRTPEFTFYLSPEAALWLKVDENGVYEEGSWIVEDALDFYEEREGMKPYEGDYIYWNMGSPGSPGVAIYEYCAWDYEGSEIGTTNYGSATFYSHFITTKEQEDYVNERMLAIVHTPGGALYDYLNASDYAKAKAAYDYVINHVSYIGTYEGYWHTAYSALHDGKATCQGYALLYMRLCRELGLPCKLLADSTYKADSFTPGSINAHAWNLVKVGSKWYHVDTNAKVFLAPKVSGCDRLQPSFNSRFKNYYLSDVATAPYGGSKSSALKAAAAMTDAQLTALDSNMTSTSARMKGTYSISGNTIKVSGTLKYMEGCTSHLGYNLSEAGSADGYFLAVSLTADKASFDDNGSVKIILTPDGQSQSKTYVLTKAAPTSEDGRAVWITDSTSSANNNRVNFLVKVGADTNTKLNVEVDFDATQDDSDYQTKTYSFDFSGLKYEEPAKSYVTVKEEAAYGIETSSPLITANAASTEVKAEYDAVAYSSNVVLPDKTKLVGNTNVAGAAISEGNYAILKVEAASSIRGTSYVSPANISVLETTGENSSEEGVLPASYVFEEETTKKAACVYLVVPMTADTNRTFTVSWGSARTQTINVCTTENCILQTLSSTAEPPKSLTFNGLLTTMYVGQSQNVSVTINKKYDMDSTQLSFSSSNPEIIRVNRITGEIKALRAGSANITVTAENGAASGTKKVNRSAKVTVKEVAAPNSVKITGLKDRSTSVTWKNNTTAQNTEVYVIPYDAKNAAMKATLGTNASMWKKNLETAFTNTKLNSAEGRLAALSSEDTAAVLAQLNATLQIPDDLGQIQAFVTDAATTEVSVEGLMAETEYLVYVRNSSKSAAGTFSATGVNVMKIKTTKTVFDTIELETWANDGVTKVEASQKTEDDIPLFVVNGDNLNMSGAPEKLSYKLLDEDGNVMDASTIASSVTFKTSNSGVIKVDSRKKTVSLGGQAGNALITVTAKDAANQIKTSKAVMIRVIKEPTALSKKTTNLSLGQSVSIRDLIGTNLRGSVDEMLLDKIDFESALAQLTATGCFTVTYSSGENAADAILTAGAYAADGKGKVKAGNSVIVPFTLKNTQGQVVSTQNATIKINDMTAPRITKVTVRDTTSTLTFTPSNGVSECNEADYYYTLELVDNVTGRKVTTEKRSASGGSLSETDKCLYSIDYSPENTDKKPMILCDLEGLKPNKTYSAYIVAHYVVPGSGLHHEKKSPAGKIATLKELITQGGSLAVNYVGFDELRNNPNSVGTTIDYDDENGIMLENNKDYLFMAQVSNLARGLETDKLKWSISSGDKRAATLKPSSSSYELKLTANKVGTFTITAVSTLTKESVATIMITIYPYQTDDGSAGGTTAPQPVAMYYDSSVLGITDEKKKKDMA